MNLKFIQYLLYEDNPFLNKQEYCYFMKYMHSLKHYRHLRRVDV